jgi:predicted RNA polymerase sigma factor
MTTISLGKRRAAEAGAPTVAKANADERLRLIFTCCHPALSMQARVALTLRMAAGLTVPEIARAFLVQETAVGQRITRAKAKIKAARIPYRVPPAEDLPARGELVTLDEQDRRAWHAAATSWRSAREPRPNPAQSAGRVPPAAPAPPPRTQRRPFRDARSSRCSQGDVGAVSPGC